MRRRVLPSRRPYVGLVVAVLLLAAACGSGDGGQAASGNGVPRANAVDAPAPPGTVSSRPDCKAIVGLRTAQFFAMAPHPNASAELNEKSKQFLRDAATRLTQAAPELQSAGERLVSLADARLSGAPEPPPAAGQPKTGKDADDRILAYERANCSTATPPANPGTTAKAGTTTAPPARATSSTLAPSSSTTASTTAAPTPAGTAPPTTAPANGTPTTRRPDGVVAAPDALPWERSYADPTPIADNAQGDLMRISCWQPKNGLKENESSGPRIAVIGDSAANLLMGPALGDPLYHWGFAAHCGETFATAIDTGRVADALAFKPDAYVLFLGSNNTRDWLVRPDLMDKAFVDLDKVLQATDAAPCRVIVDLPELEHPELGDAGGHGDTPELAKTRVDLAHRVNEQLHAATSRPGVHIAELSKAVKSEPRKYVWDEIHPTRAGINLMINLIIETAQPCFAPAPPTNVQAVETAGSTVVSWNAVAANGGGATTDVTYNIETSDGRTLTSSEPRLSLPDSTPGTTERYRVRARTAAAVTGWSDWAFVDSTTPAQKRWLPAVPLVLGALVIAVVVVLQRRRDRRIMSEVG